MLYRRASNHHILENTPAPLLCRDRNCYTFSQGSVPCSMAIVMSIELKAEAQLCVYNYQIDYRMRCCPLKKRASDLDLQLGKLTALLRHVTLVSPAQKQRCLTINRPLGCNLEKALGMPHTDCFITI